MIDRLVEFVRERFFGLWDYDIVSEMYTYVRDDKGRTNAQDGKHDDCIMALAISLQAVLDRNGQEYIPEVSRDDKGVVIKKDNFDVPNIIDPLFEVDDDLVECT